LAHRPATCAFGACSGHARRSVRRSLIQELASPRGCLGCRPPAPITAGGAFTKIVPSSDVLVALQAPPVARLQPIGSCDSTPCPHPCGWGLSSGCDTEVTHQRDDAARLTCSAGSAVHASGEGHTTNVPERLPSYSDAACSRLQPLPLAVSFEGIRSRLTHPFAFCPPAIASANRGFIPARSRSSACLAAPRDHATRDASEPTSATQHCFDYEHPRLVGSRTESPDFRLALDGEPSVSRRPTRFGCPCGFVSWGGVVFPGLPQVVNPGHEPPERASGTSVASPPLIDGACARIDRHQVRLGCFYRVSVKITRCPQPEMPSIDK